MNIFSRGGLAPTSEVCVRRHPRLSILPACMTILVAAVYFAAGAGLGYVLYRAIRAAWGNTRVGRFLSLWVAFSLLGIGGMGAEFLTSDHGFVRTKGGTYYQTSWGEVFTLTPAFALIVAVPWYLRDERERRAARAEREAGPGGWSSEYVAEILAAEARSTARQCEHMARRLVREAERSQRPLPSDLEAFARRYLQSSP